MESIDWTDWYYHQWVAWSVILVLLPCQPVGQETTKDKGGGQMMDSMVSDRRFEEEGQVNSTDLLDRSHVVSLLPPSPNWHKQYYHRRPYPNLESI